MGQLENISAFVKIVETGNITRAAKQMNIVKSALSRRLAELENSLGTQLIHRTTRHFSVTEAGENYYQRAIQILADVNDLNSSTSNEKIQIEGPLKISVPLSFGLQNLSPLIREFTEQHPKLLISVDFSDRSVNLVEEGFDLAIRISNLKDSTLMARKIAPIRMVICASPAYLEEYGEPKTPQDFKQHHVLQYTLMPSPIWKFNTPNGKEVNISVNIKMSANNGDFLRDAAIDGQGIIKTPTFIVWKDIKSGKLTPIMGEYKVESLNAYVIYPPTPYLSNRVRTFIDFLVHRLQGEPYWDIGMDVDTNS
ncbi:MAG: LysR family transcriptional regulator [Alphaproteobacteria bacterium]|nr:MAG: LysR family transcriptional regulator [Alphaproteobacteria bacterium]